MRLKLGSLRRDPWATQNLGKVPLQQKGWKTLVHTHRTAVQSSFKDQVEWIHLWLFLVPSWCGASRTIWDCCWTWGISSPGAAAPATLEKGKVGTKMSKWMSMYAYIEPSYLWNCLYFVCQMNVVFKQLSTFGQKLAFLWKWVKSIRHRREGGVDTLKLHHDTLSKTLKKTRA